MESKWDQQSDMRSYLGYANPTPRSTAPIPHQSQVYGHNLHNLSMRSYSADPPDPFEDPRYHPELHARMYTDQMNRSHSPLNMTYASYHDQTVVPPPQYHTQGPYAPPRGGYSQHDASYYQPRRQTSPPRQTQSAQGYFKVESAYSKMRRQTSPPRHAQSAQSGGAYSPRRNLQ